MKIIILVVCILQSVGVFGQTWCLPAVYPNTPPSVYGQSSTAVYPNTPPSVYGQSPTAVYPTSANVSIQTAKPLIVGVSVVRSSGVTLSVVGAPGVKYTIEFSGDMKIWNDGGEVLIGSSGQGTANVPFQLGRQFFRVRAG